ncbi:MAG: HAD-IIIA family hydrolase, partial [Gemmatimonadetes bacterium]|nr:HAD-IIIA family hydrolase [Gemmatimonadota bacterium]
MTKWGVFLDRDGTLVPNVPYAVEPSQLRLYRTAAAALARLIDQRARLVVVSNQSAVARGLLSRAGLRRMDARLKALLGEEGVRLARAYYCPHHPQWGGPCRCRKPKPGLIQDGLKSLGLEASRCYLIGDSMDD